MQTFALVSESLYYHIKSLYVAERNSCEMEGRENHINIHMIEDVGQNRTSGQTVITKDPVIQRHGATVSFHNVQYSVTMKSSSCKKKSVTKDILVDLK